MIVNLEEYYIKTISGKDTQSGVVYCSYKNDTICYTRKYVKPKTTAHNRLCGAKLQKISLLYKVVPDSFKECLRLYAHAYNKQLLPAKKAPVNAFNIFVKALCNHKVSLSDLDTIERIVSLYGGTISSWVEHSLLQEVDAKIPNIDILTGIMRVNTDTEPQTIIKYTLLYMFYIASILKSFHQAAHAPFAIKPNPNRERRFWQFDP